MKDVENGFQANFFYFRALFTFVLVQLHAYLTYSSLYINNAHIAEKVSVLLLF